MIKAVEWEHSFVRRRILRPLLQLLRIGVSPERLAWSIAIGLVIGVNPLLGSTTVLALAVASAFRLNVVASQCGIHLMYPLELLLFPVFIKLGSLLFRTPGLPMGFRAIVQGVRLHPLNTTRILWRWEWHALVVWVVLACITTPVLKILLKPMLIRMLHHLHHEPIVEK